MRIFRIFCVLWIAGFFMTSAGAETATVYFDFAKDDIRPDAAETLDHLASLWKQVPPEAGTAIELEGHTDSVDTEPFNIDLSKRRAEAVRAYLMQKMDWPASRFEIAYFGESQPVAENDNPEHRQLNRRVKIVFPLGGRTRAMDFPEEPKPSPCDCAPAYESPTPCVSPRY